MADETQMIVDKSGKRFSVPKANLEKALATGEYRLPTPADLKNAQYAQEPGRAALEAGARGFTLGLSDPVMRGLGVPQEDLRGRKEQNPTASMAGEVAGTVASMLLPGGAAGAAAKAGRGVEAASAVAGLGKTAARFTGGVAEGSLYGLGKVIDEHSLGEPQTNAEKLVALSGLGGGLFNALGGKLADIASDKALKAFGGKNMSEYLKSKSEDILISKLATPGELTKRNLQNRIKDVVRYGLDNDLIQGTVPESLAAVNAHRQGVGQEIGDILADADSKSLGFDSARLWVKARPILKEMQKDPANASGRDFLSSYLGDMQTGQRNLADAWKLQSEMLKKLPNEIKGANEHIRNFRNLFRDEIVEQAGEVSPYHAKVLSNASDRYGKARELEKMLEGRARNEMAGKAFNLGDELAGEFGSLIGYSKYGPAGILLGAGSAMTRKFLRERGALTVARGLNDLAETSFPQIADNFRRVIQNKLDSGENFGTFRAGLENALANGADALLAQHVQMSKNPEYMQTLGMEHETPEASGDYATKLVQLNTIQDQLALHDAMAHDAFKTFLGKTSGRPAGAVSPMTDSDFQKTKGMINAAMNNPQVAAELTPKGMEGVAPQTQLLVGQVRMAGIQFLASKLPKDPNEGRLPALMSKWQPAKCEIARFGRYARAVANPSTVLEDARHGRMAPEGVEVLRTLYPALFAEYEKVALTQLSELTKPISFQKRQALAQLFGPQFVGQDPGLTKLIQDAHAATVSQDPSNVAGAPGTDGRQEVDTAKNMQTQGQRLESRSKQV